MKNIILLTNANMGRNAGDTTLVLRRAKALFDVKGFFTHIIVYRGVHQDEGNKGDYYYSVEKAERLSSVENSIAALKPEIIIFYGNKTELIIKPLKRFCRKNNIDTKLILDVQGSIEEVWEYGSFQRKIFYPLHLFYLKKALKNVNGAFVVSNELRENCEKKLKGKNKLEYYKVRCGVNQLGSWGKKERDMKEFRSDKKVPLDSIVFCFSGFRTGWQKLDETINKFKEFDHLVSNAFFCFFCNTDAEFEKRLALAFPKKNFFVGLLQPSEVQKGLNACDVGFLLRDRNETNRVAFPNKFSEYVNAGLVVAISDALPEPRRLLINYGLPYIDTDLPCDKTLSVLGNCKSPDFFTKCNVLVEKELLYNNQIERINF